MAQIIAESIRGKGNGKGKEKPAAVLQTQSHRNLRILHFCTALHCTARSSLHVLLLLQLGDLAHFFQSSKHAVPLLLTHYPVSSASGQTIAHAKPANNCCSPRKLLRPNGESTPPRTTPRRLRRCAGVEATLMIGAASSRVCDILAIYCIRGRKHESARFWCCKPASPQKDARLSHVPYLSRTLWMKGGKRSETSGRRSR